MTGEDSDLNFSGLRSEKCDESHATHAIPSDEIGVFELAGQRNFLFQSSSRISHGRWDKRTCLSLPSCFVCWLFFYGCLFGVFGSFLLLVCGQCIYFNTK